MTWKELIQQQLDHLAVQREQATHAMESAATRLSAATEAKAKAKQELEYARHRRDRIDGRMDMLQELKRQEEEDA